MKREVYFSDLRADAKRNVLDKIKDLLERTGIREKVKRNSLVALKLNFGEKGNTSYIHPSFIREVVKKVKELQGKPFLTDTTTLYEGSRNDAASSIQNAIENGFSYSVVGAPIIIADGLRGDAGIAVRIDKGIYKEVQIAQGIYEADSLICLSHFKCHDLTGFGGAIKNLAMGCSTRAGKLSQHSSVAPYVNYAKCVGCGTCLEWCRFNAISITEKRGASIRAEACTGCARCITACPERAIGIRWNEESSSVQKKMAEYALGAIKGKEGRSIFLNFLIQIAPDCDCANFTDTPIVGDIGIAASVDPVALDQASADLVNKKEGNRESRLTANFRPGEDKFRGLYPKIDWETQLEYGEKIGLGTRNYRLIRI